MSLDLFLIKATFHFEDGSQPKYEPLELVLSKSNKRWILEEKADYDHRQVKEAEPLSLSYNIIKRPFTPARITSGSMVNVVDDYFQKGYFVISSIKPYTPNYERRKLKNKRIGNKEIKD